jgi:hypothetical protein
VNNPASGDLFLDRLAAATGAVEKPAPSRLKSRIYSALMKEEASAGPLASVSESKQHDGKLCVFEELVRIAPVGEGAKSLNYCRVCHARVLGETVENAPIYWSGCPYVRFQNR